MQGLKKFLTHCSGATAIEYAMIAGGIALAVSGAVYAIGSQVSALLLSISGGF